MNHHPSCYHPHSAHSTPRVVSAPPQTETVDFMTIAFTSLTLMYILTQSSNQFDQSQAYTQRTTSSRNPRRHLLSLTLSLSLGEEVRVLIITANAPLLCHADSSWWLVACGVVGPDLSLPLLCSTKTGSKGREEPLSRPRIISRRSNESP